MTKKLSIVLIALLFGGESLMAGNNYTGMNQQIMSDPQARIAMLDESVQQLRSGLDQLRPVLKRFHEAVDKDVLDSKDTQKGAFNEIFYRTLTLMAIAETSNVNYNEREQAIKDEIQRINKDFKDFNSFRNARIGNRSKVLHAISFAKKYFDAKENMIKAYYDMADSISSLEKEHIEGYVVGQVIRLSSEIDRIKSAITPQEEEKSPQVKAKEVWHKIKACRLLYSKAVHEGDVHVIDRLLTDENVNIIINHIKTKHGIETMEVGRENIKDTFNEFINDNRARSGVADYIGSFLLGNRTKIEQSADFLSKVPTDSCQEVSKLLSQINDIDDKKEIQSIVLNNLDYFTNAVMDLLFWQIEKHDADNGKQLSQLTDLVFTVANDGNKYTLMCRLFDNIITTDDGYYQVYRNRFLLSLTNL